MLPDIATSSFLNALNFLTSKDKITFNPIFWIAQLESDPKHTEHARLSLMVLELIAVKFYKIAKSGNTVTRVSFNFGLHVGLTSVLIAIHNFSGCNGSKECLG